MKLIFIDIAKIFCLITYTNFIIRILCYMYPKFMTKMITYFKLFSVTILITISWLAQFGTIGKYIIWTIDDKEYSINLPRLGNDDEF